MLPAHSHASSPYLTGIKTKLDEYIKKNSSPLPCTGAVYSSNAQAAANCQTCKGVVSNWKKKAPAAVDSAIAQDTSITNTNQLEAGKAVGRVENAVTSVKNEKDVATAAKLATDQREANSRHLAEEMKSCAKEIYDKCKNIAPNDAKIANGLHDACEQGGTSATTAGNQQKSDGLGLGDLSKGMDLATKALGLGAAAMQMANAANQQGQGAGTDPNSTMSGGGATAPTPSSINDSGTSSGPESASLGTGKDGKGTSTPSVGIGSPNGQFVAASKNSQGAGNGGGSTGSSGSSGGFGSGGSNPLGANGAAAQAGGSGGGGSGGGAGGSSDSSGSSRPGAGGTADGAGAGAGGNNFEVSGGGGKPMLGMKGSKADLDEVTGGAAAEPALSDLGARDPASVGEDQAGGIEAEDSESVFQRVRSKYASLKGKGRF
jgi:hypothetical protein